jgi:hypothetical protein
MWKEARVDLGKSSGPINHNELALLQLKRSQNTKGRSFQKFGKPLWMGI